MSYTAQTMKAGPYTNSYYSRQEGGSVASARVVIPIVIELIHPRSVIDIGCGVGTWLSVCKEHGIEGIRGFDGSWVKKEKLHIPSECFTSIDIESLSDTGCAADLAISLEVGEHVSKAAAPRLVAALTKAAPVVLFSAAIPYQGGTHHVNEQWPAYWAAHFRAQGYVPIDCIRKRVWNDPNIEFWYAQNTIVYVDEKRISQYPALVTHAEPSFPDPLPLVHPTKFLYVAERYKLLEPFLAFLPGGLVRSGKRFLSKIMSRGA